MFYEIYCARSPDIKTTCLSVQLHTSKVKHTNRPFTELRDIWEIEVVQEGKLT